MRVAGQLDVDQPVVADVGQRREHVGQVDLPLAEGQVLVDAAAHVVDLDVDDEVPGGPDDLRREASSLHVRWPTSIVSPSDSGRPSRSMRPTTSPTRSRNIPGSGSSARVTPAACATGSSRVTPPRPGAALLRRRRGRQGSAPARHDARPEVGRDPQGGGDEVDAPLAALVADERRVVLAAGVQHVAAARLHDDVEVVLAQQRRGHGDPLRQPRPSGSRWAWSRVRATPSKPRSASTASASPSRWSVKPLRP